MKSVCNKHEYFFVTINGELNLWSTVQATTLANFVGKVVTFYHVFVSLPSPLFNVGFQWTFLLQYCLANIQHGNRGWGTGE